MRARETSTGAKRKHAKLTFDRCHTVKPRCNVIEGRSLLQRTNGYNVLMVIPAAYMDGKTLILEIYVSLNYSGVSQ